MRSLTPLSIPPATENDHAVRLDQLSDVSSDETIFAPAFTVTDATSLDLDITFVWGIDGDGDPYYNAAGVTAGEEAVLVLNNTSGELSLRPVEI